MIERIYYSIPHQEGLFPHDRVHQKDDSDYKVMV
jgi:hypothetical protein